MTLLIVVLIFTVVFVLIYLLLVYCSQLIVDRGIEIFEKNNAELTACDLAMSNGHQDIADLLESRMVFAVSGSQSGWVTEWRIDARESSRVSILGYCVSMVAEWVGHRVGGSPSEQVMEWDGSQSGWVTE